MTFNTAHRGGSRVALLGWWKGQVSEGDNAIWTQLEWFEG